MLGPVVCDIAGTVLTEEDVKRISHPLVGMVILFTRNYENPVQLAELCKSIHAVKPGLLISVDQEGGRVQRFREGFTEIPAMRDYGVQWKDDPEAAARSVTAAGFVLAAELRACGVDLNRMMDEGILFPIREINVKYKHSARFDDEYEVQTTMQEFNRAKMVFSYKVVNVKDGKVFVEGNTTNVFTDKNGKILRLPAAWFEKINAAYQEEKQI